MSLNQNSWKYLWKCTYSGR